MITKVMLSGISALALLILAACGGGEGGESSQYTEQTKVLSDVDTTSDGMASSSPVSQKEPSNVVSDETSSTSIETTTLFSSRLAMELPATQAALYSLSASNDSNEYATSDRGAFLMPYTRYESDSAQSGGGSVLRTASKFRQTETVAEASNQSYVSLPSNGSYVEWPITTTGNGVTLRFTLPDSTDGRGQTGTLDVYINDKFDQTIRLSSYYSWQYFSPQNLNKPTNTPGGRAMMRFDEVHFRLGQILNPGDRLRIQKNTGDALDYGLDFIELEQINDVITKPAGYISIADYGAIPNDNIDDLQAFKNSMAQAVKNRTGIYLPPGRFLFNQKINLIDNDIGIQGAGIWHTEIYFSNPNRNMGGIFMLASGMKISNIYLNTANNRRFDDSGNYIAQTAFGISFGSNSRIENVWAEHFETGAWVGGYGTNPRITKNLVIANSRFRNNYADGVNFTQGTSNSLVEHSNVRNSGDDGLAIYPSGETTGIPEGVENTFRFNTIEHTWRAGSVAIFGGRSQQAHHLLIRDCFASSGVRLNSDFAGYTFSKSGLTELSHITIQRCGTSSDIYSGPRAALEMNGQKGIRNMLFSNISIIDSQRHAIQLSGTAYINMNFNNITITNVGLDEATLDLTRSKSAKLQYGGVGIISEVDKGVANFNCLAISGAEDRNVLLPSLWPKISSFALNINPECPNGL